MGPSSSTGLRITPRWPRVKIVFLLFREGLEKKPAECHGQGANNTSTNIIFTTTFPINISTSYWSTWKDTLLGRVLHPHQVVFVCHLLILRSRHIVSLHSNS